MFCCLGCLTRKHCIGKQSVTLRPYNKVISEKVGGRISAYFHAHKLWSQNISCTFVIVLCEKLFLWHLCNDLKVSYFLLFPVSMSTVFIQPSCLSYSIHFIVFVALLLQYRRQSLLYTRHWKQVNSVFMVTKLGNMCFGRKTCVLEANTFLTWGKTFSCYRAAKCVSARYVPRAVS